MSRAGEGPAQILRPRRGALCSAVAMLVLLLGSMPARAAALLREGDTFPTWSLRDHTGKQVSSQDLAGKTYLLWFFPKAMTPGCTREGDGLRDQFTAFRDAGVEVLGVSFDTPSDNAQFVTEQGFPFRLLSDDGALAVQVGAADSRDQHVARRISYLVGPDGKVKKSYGNVDPATHAGQVLGDVAPPKGS
jgi:peroxiredoxin Q/BCP